MDEIKSPLAKVPEVSRILRQKPVTTYDQIKKNVYPPGVIVRLGERSIRFHREKLLEWIAQGGKAA